MNRPDHDTTEHPLPGDCVFTREHLEAYSLQALDRVDHGIIEQHLRWCDDCRAEAVALERVAAALPFAGLGSNTVSDSTWSSILARIETPELAPSAVADVTEQPATAPARRSWQSIVYPSIVAPLVIALVVMGAWVNSLSNQNNDRNRELANNAVISSSLGTVGEVQLYSVQPNCKRCEAIAQVGVSQHNNMGMLVGTDFDPAETHDVWGLDLEGEKQKFCSLVVESNGEVLQMFLFPSSPSGFTELYITDANGNLAYVTHLTHTPLATTPDI